MLRPLQNIPVSLKQSLASDGRKELGQKLQFSELNYLNVLESMDEGFVSCEMIYDKAGKSVDFRYLYVNPNFAKLIGLTTESILGRTAKEVLPKIEQFWIKTCDQVVRTGKSERFKHREAPHGKQLDIRVWRSGKACFAAIITDITDNLRTEKEVKFRNKKLELVNKSQEETKQAMLNVMEDLEAAKALIEVARVKDEAILNSIGEGLITVSNEQKIMTINKAAKEMLGIKGNELIGKECSSLPLEDNEGQLIPLEKRPTYIAIKTGKSVSTDYSYIRKDNTKLHMAIIVTPIKIGEKMLGAVGIFRDITREKEVDKAKSEFVSIASHQLRTPLGIIKWYLEALENEDYIKKSPPIVSRYVDEIYKSNERVLSLVRDLLSVSRIDQGRVKNDPKAVDIVYQITNIVEQMQVFAHKKNLSLNLAIKDKKIPSVNIDILRFHEVIENLITNALEYTMPGGVVDVAVTAGADELLISVKDTGIGISDLEQKKLFTKFFRAEKAIGLNPEGSGLGLYVAKSYLEGWGGKLRAESKEGKGSIFTISLPSSQKN